MKRLTTANPVTERLAVDSFVAPDEPIGEEVAVALPSRRAGGHARRNSTLALAGLAGAAVVSLLLASGSSNSPVDVLAAVYAATAPRAGIVESVTVVRNDFGPGHRSSERLREWLQSSASQRRTALTITGSGAAAHADIVFTLHAWEGWSAGASRLLPFGLTGNNTIRRVLWSGQIARNNERVGFSAGFVGQQSQIFHTMYLKRQFRVAGRVRRGGWLLWKLVETPARAAQRAREDQTSYYVLVDPHSFQPVYTRLIDLARPGSPTISEDELVSLRTLPATPANENLFDLALQHPHARVSTQTMRAEMRAVRPARRSHPARSNRR